VALPECGALGPVDLVVNRVSVVAGLAPILNLDHSVRLEGYRGVPVPGFVQEPYGPFSAVPLSVWHFADRGSVLRRCRPESHSREVREALRI
jgi:hypothetical protein